MKKFIYLWINNFSRLDDFDEKKGYLFQDLGLSLSSEYKVHGERNELGVLEITVSKNANYQKSFYSSNLTDVKVLVGNNGTGKSTILKTLFKIITKKGFRYNGNEEYVLVFVENKKIHIVSSRTIKTKLNIKSPNLEEGKNFSFSKDLPIYFSPEFKENIDTLFDENYKNISTNGYLCRDRQTILNAPNDIQEIYSRKDERVYHFEMEQNRVIEFMLNAGEKFFNIIPVPQMMIMKPLRDNIDCGINDLVNLYINHYGGVGSLIDCFPDIVDYDLERALPENLDRLDGEVKELIISKIKKFFYKCYDEICDSVGKKFLFATLLSCVRTFSSKQSHNAIDSVLEVDWKKFEQAPYKTINDFFYKNKDNNIGKQGLKTKNIIEISKKCKTTDDSIIFDLRYRKQILRDVRDLYNTMYFLYPLFSFEFTRALSSGENQFVRFYSRLYSCLKEAAKKKASLDSICLLVDEADLFMHPEWQRKWFDVFIDLLKDMQYRLKKVRKDVNSPLKKPFLGIGETLKVQLIMATHSPFIVTDCLNENIIKLQREKDENGNRFGKVVCVNEKINSFAGNIYDILKEGFFLEGTLGYRTEQKLKDLIKHIENGEKYSETLISQIGDPILKALILQKKGVSNDKNKN